MPIFLPQLMSRLSSTHVGYVMPAPRANPRWGQKTCDPTDSPKPVNSGGSGSIQSGNGEGIMISPVLIVHAFQTLRHCSFSYFSLLLPHLTEATPRYSVEINSPCGSWDTISADPLSMFLQSRRKSRYNIGSDVSLNPKNEIKLTSSHS